MAPTLHLIRHAQGFHNLSLANHAMHDPLLTPLGHEQCKALQRNFPHHKQVDCIVASPLKRTMYTALSSFENDIKKKHLRVIALPELQETSDLPCDTGSSPEQIEKEFHEKPVDLSLVKAGWNVKKGKWGTSADAIRARARDARIWLENRKEHEIVVVSHGGFLHYFTEDWSDCGRFQGTGWGNTEYRSYNFSADGEHHLIETPESKQRRQPKPLDHNEFEQLKRSNTVEAADQAQKDAMKGHGEKTKA